MSAKGQYSFRLQNELMADVKLMVEENKSDNRTVTNLIETMLIEKVKKWKKTKAKS